MRFLRILVLPLLSVVLLAGTTAAAGASSVPCKSGTYSGKAGSGKLQFTVNCTSMKVSNPQITSLPISCLPDNHKLTVSATYTGSAKIKKTRVPDPDHPGKKEIYYVLFYLKSTSDFTAKGLKSDAVAPTKADVFVRITKPLTGTVVGTADVSLSYGISNDDPEAGFDYNCGSSGGPVKFQVRRS